MTSLTPELPVAAAPSERLLNYEQLCDKLGGTTRRTIDRWVMDGTIPTSCKVMVAGSARFIATRVDSWIRAGCPGAQDDCTICGNPATHQHNGRWYCEKDRGNYID